MRFRPFFKFTLRRNDAGVFAWVFPQGFDASFSRAACAVVAGYDFGTNFLLLICLIPNDAVMFTYG